MIILSTFISISSKITWNVYIYPCGSASYLVASDAFKFKRSSRSRYVCSNLTRIGLSAATSMSMHPLSRPYLAGSSLKWICSRWQRLQFASGDRRDSTFDLSSHAALSHCPIGSVERPGEALPAVIPPFGSIYLGFCYLIIFLLLILIAGMASAWREPHTNRSWIWSSPAAIVWRSRWYR